MYDIYFAKRNIFKHFDTFKLKVDTKNMYFDSKWKIILAQKYIGK